MDKTTAIALASLGAAALVLHKYSSKKPHSAPQRAVVSKVDPFLQAQIDRNGIAFGESKSTYFSGVEDYKLVMTEAEVDMAVQKVAEVLNKKFAGKKIILVGILKGAFVFMSHLVRGQVRGEMQLLSRIVPKKFEGRHVVLVDELLDHGATMENMKQHLLEKLSLRPTDVTKCVLFAKDNKARPASLSADIVGIDNLPDLWFVGCGLDDDGTKRGWPHLYAKRKAEGIPLVRYDGVFSKDVDPDGSLYLQMRKDVMKNLNEDIKF